MNRLANWNNEDGAPFKKGDIIKTLIGPPRSEYRKLTDLENIGHQRKINQKTDLGFDYILGFASLPILSILAVEYQEVIELISDMKGNRMFEDRFNQNLTIYASYPFNHTAEIIIPYIDTNFGVGEVLWELSKVYENIFLEEWKKYQVEGHRLSDLVFEEIKFIGEYEAILELGS